MNGMRAVSLIIRNPLVCEGLRRILNDNDFDVVSLGDEIDAELADESLIIVDRDLLPTDSFGELKKLIHRHPGSRVIVLSSKFAREDAAQAFAAGSFAFFLSDTPLPACVAMMQLVSIGQKVAPSELIDALGDMHVAASGSEPHIDMVKLDFTEREQEILRHLVKGSPNKVISRHLGVSESAVKASVKSVLRKLSVQNRTQAAILAHDSEFHPVTSTLAHQSTSQRLQAGRRSNPAPDGGMPVLPNLY